MTDSASPPPSGAHDHNDLYHHVEVAQSREIRQQLQPLVAELQRMIDRLEEFYDHPEEPPSNGTAGPRSRP